MRDNRVLVLPVNILTVWRAGFTWPHNTLPCVLIRVGDFSPILPTLIAANYVILYIFYKSTKKSLHSDDVI